MRRSMKRNGTKAAIFALLIGIFAVVTQQTVSAKTNDGRNIFDSVYATLTNLITGENAPSATVAATKPFDDLVIGTCDTSGPIEIESTGGLTTPTAYATLTAAFTAINAGTHTGAINIEVCASTTEAASAVLNSSGAGSASYTSISIRPLVDGVTISGPTVTGRGLIELNGADNVTIDGDNPNTTGTNRNLTITNTAANTITYTSVIRVAVLVTTQVSADNNTFRNLILLGNATARNASANTSTTGSENTTFGIYAGGNGGATTTAPSALTSVTTNTAVSGTTINNFTANNNSINAVARAVVFNGAVATVAAGTTAITNNTIGVTGAPTTTVYTRGMYVAGTTSLNASGNSINLASYVGTTMTAIDLVSPVGATGGTIAINDNNIGSVTQSGASAARGIAQASAVTTFSIARNTVSNITVPTTGTSAIGIDVSSTAASPSGIVDRNNITNIKGLGASTYQARGISLNSGTQVTIQNNFVSDIANNAAGSGGFGTSFSPIGIYVGGGTNHRIYHNSVNMFGTIAGTASGILSAAFQITATSITGLDVRNNIFANTLTGGLSGGSAHVSIALPSSGTSAMNLTINNNDYFSGTTAGSQGIAFVGTTYSATPAGPTTYAGLYTAANFNPADTASTTNLRTYTNILSTAGTNDNASIVTDPLFVSTTDLHLTAGSPDRNIAANVGVTTDFDGQTRPGANAFYDIGADEFDGATPLANDIAATAIITPANGSATAVGSAVTPQASFTNVGTATQTNVQVQFTITGPGGYSYTNTQTIATITPNQTVTVTFASAPAFTTAGSYTTTATVLTADGNAANNTVSGSFTVVPPVTGGTYNVPGDYASLTNAGGIFAALNAGGATGNIIINITADLTAETGANALNNLPNNYSVTIKPTGAARTISGAAASTALIRLNGASNVTIDGSLSGGTDRSLTISNTSTTSPTTVRFGSIGTTPFINDVLKNCVIINGVNTSSAVTATDTGGSTAGYFNNLTIQNNDVQRAFRGVFVNAIVSGTNGSGTSITGNSLNTAGTNSIRLNPIFVAGANGVSITNNTLGNISDANAEVPAGIILSTGADNAVVSGNTISGISSTDTTSSSSASGIVVTVGTTATSVNVSNNAISNLNSAGTAANFYGIGVLTSANVTAAGNTVSGMTQNGAATGTFGIVYSAVTTGAITGNTVSALTSPTTGTVSGINVQGASTGVLVNRNKVFNIKNTNTGGYGANGIQLSSSSTTANVSVRNNFVYDIAGYGYASGFGIADNGYGIIITAGAGYNVYFNSVNINTNQTTAGNAAAINITSGVTAAGAIDLRDNIFANTQTAGNTRYAIYSGAANTVFSAIDYNDYFSAGTALGYIGSERATLTDIQTGFGGNTNSKAVNPQFVSATDLHLQPTSPLIGQGVTIAGVTVDIDNETRDNPPEIGADELVAVQPGTLQFSSATYSVGEAGGTVTLTVNRTGGSDGAVTVNYATASGTATGGASCATTGVDYISASGTLNFANGETSKTFNVTICNDTVFEGNEAFTATLSTATGGATIGTPSTATVTIIDDDVQPTISINDVSLNEGNSGTTAFNFTVSLSNASTQTVTVNYATANGTAIAPGDYATTNGTVTFAAGQTTQTITVLVNGDTTPETNETFFVNLTTPVNATISDNQGQGTIVNDDADTTAPVISYTPLPAKASASTSTLAVTVTDNVAVQSVSITYAIGAGATQTVACTSVGGSSYNCLINETGGDNQTISYYVSATDTSNNTSRNPATSNNGYAIGTTNIQGGTYDTLNVLNGSLAGNVTVNTNFSYTGAISSSGGTLTLGCDATIDAGNVNKYVNAQITKNFCSAPQTFTYPTGNPANVPTASELGVTSYYTPLTVNVTAVVNPSSLTVSMSDQTMPGADPANSISRYWSLTEAGSITADLTFQYDASDVTGNESAFKVIKNEGGVRTSFAGSTVNPAAHTATVTGISDFSLWSVGLLAPTAANASISGRVLTADGQGIRNAELTISGGNITEPRRILTGAFGFYKFDDLEVGQTYIITIKSKRYVFTNPTAVFTLRDDIADYNFQAAQ